MSPQATGFRLFAPLSPASRRNSACSIPDGSFSNERASGSPVGLCSGGSPSAARRSFSGAEAELDARGGQRHALEVGLPECKGCVANEVHERVPRLGVAGQECAEPEHAIDDGSYLLTDD